MFNLTPPPLTYETLIRFIKDFTNEKKVVLGLSGGVDSSLVARLLVDALGPEKVVGLYMPDQYSDYKDLEDAEEYAKTLKIEFRIINIDSFVDQYVKVFGDIDRKVLGNIKARIRMTLLFTIANQENALVAGTGNKSELLVGYFTKYGDGAADFYPIADLYKTQVWQLAKDLKLPESIQKKVPSAGLWKGQTDEGEIGLSYANLDKILHGFELTYNTKNIADLLNIDQKTVEKVEAMINSSKHKRIGMYIPKIGVRTVNTDWNE